MVLNELENIREAELIATNFLLECKKENTWLHTDVDGIYTSFIYPEYGEYELRYAHIYKKTDDGERWGLTDYKKRRIVLDVSLLEQNKARHAFTFAHEIRHVIDFHNGIVPLPKYLTTEEHLAIERRADIFAAHLLMPTDFVHRKFVEKFGHCYPIKYYGPGDYCCNGRLKRGIRTASELNSHYVRELTPYFSHVSIQSASLRLQEMGLLAKAPNNNIVSFDFLEQKNIERKNDLLQLMAKWKQ